MSSPVQILDRSNDPQWDQFVLSHVHGTIYHTTLWRDLIVSTYGLKPYYLAIKNESGSIQAALPTFSVRNVLGNRRLCTLPLAQYCNPLINNNDQLTDLIDFVNDLLKKTGSFNFELKTDGKVPIDPGKQANVYNGFNHYRLDLSDEIAAIKKRFHKSCVTRCINKSLRCGLELKKATSIEDVSTFYKLYLHMRKRLGLPPQPIEFFRLMWKIFAEKGYMDIFFAVHEGSPISTVLLLKFKGTVIYEYGASIRHMINLHPSHFLLWEAINQAKVENFEVFDFGRTSKDNKGLSKFKERWGTKQDELHYFYFPALKGFDKTKNVGFITSATQKISKFLPNRIFEVYGKIFYKHFQ